MKLNDVPRYRLNRERSALIQARPRISYARHAIAGAVFVALHACSAIIPSRNEYCVEGSKKYPACVSNGDGGKGDMPDITPIEPEVGVDASRADSGAQMEAGVLDTGGILDSGIGDIPDAQDSVDSGECISGTTEMCITSCGERSRRECIDAQWASCLPGDRDRDTINDCEDNCPDTPNTDQQDAPLNGRPGDACDPEVLNAACENTVTLPNITLENIIAPRIELRLDDCGNVFADPNDGIHAPDFWHNIPPFQAGTQRFVRFIATQGAIIRVCAGTTDMDAARINRIGRCRTFRVE
ncbi:hypothetical protein COV82_00285 [Candidatus Peregrinibacteria bacterium CG11_big_fil_rev_8_21_14_0_20_46_8]|nr:MAG: hypothetical protein COV82_00285 [Candidatus Peregrinibacteria bacterium CG11_big_fil_rev_8_21_14_0_20_46_8]